MIPLNDTATYESDVKWVVKILGDNNTYYMTDSDNGLVLNNSYIGDGLHKTGDFETLSLITDSVDITGGGNLGQVSSFTFGIIRWSSDTKLDGFMNEFYPATSGEYLVGREVNVGVIWNGANDSNITWLKRFYIEEYSYQPAFINIYCVEKTELDWMELPFYEVQKDYDNGVSYFPSAPDENVGTPIPILYGDFTNVENIGQYYYNFSYAPGLLTELSTMSFVFASHECFSTANQVYQYLSSLDTYMELYKTSDAGVLVTNDTRYLIALQDSWGELFGSMAVQLNEVAQETTTANSMANAIDPDTTSYSTLENSAILALRTSGSASGSAIGSLSVNNIDLALIAYLASADGTSESFDLGAYNNNVDPLINDGSSYTKSGTSPEEKTWTFGANTTPKKDSNLPWSIEEVLGLDYFIYDTDSGSGGLRIYSAYLKIANIKVVGIVKKILSIPEAAKKLYPGDPTGPWRL